MKMHNKFGIYWHWHWQNLDDSEKVERAEDALTKALRDLGALSNDRWREISEVRLRFHDALTGRLGHGWRNGRAWLHVYWGNPNSDAKGDGHKLATCGAQWVLFSRQHSLGATLNVGTGDADDGVTFSLQVPLFGVYLSVEDVRALRRFMPKRKARSVLHPGDTVYLPSPRELGATWHSGALWIKLWNDMHEWSSSAPIWDARSKWRQPTIHPMDILFGRTHHQSEDISTEAMLLRLPEGQYPVAVTRTRRTWTRPRLPWWRKTAATITIASDGGIPIPGKGESGWDMEDDATYSFSTHAPTVEAAAAALVASVLERRERYAGHGWVPAAGWPEYVQP